MLGTAEREHICLLPSGIGVRQVLERTGENARELTVANRRRVAGLEW